MKFFSRDNLLFLKKNFQLVYAVILLILIPAGLVINTVVFINNTQKLIDVELQRKAMLANQVLGENIPRYLDDTTILQTILDQIASQNEEIRSLDVLTPEDDGFKIVASLDPVKVGQASTQLNNSIAWQRQETIASLTTSPARSTEDQEQVSEERFWIVVSPVYNAEGKKIALSSMKVSSKVIDDLTQLNINRSIVVLIVTILVIILLLVNNTRLFQYAVLFRKLKEVDEMKDEFISMASHELRAPITGIKGYLTMMLDGSFGEIGKEVKEKLQLVHGATNRLNDLVEDLLDVSRIEQARVKLNIEPLDIKSVIQSTIVDFVPQAREKNLQLVYVEAKEPLPKVLADNDKLKQVLVNLVSNAIKYTLKGKVSMETVPKEKFMELKVIDTGIGMSSKARERLFEKFYRIKTRETQNVAGTGLGLWITRELVRMMKGEIYVDSIENVGTQFTVLLPIYEEKKS